MELDPQKLGEHAVTFAAALGVGKLIEFFTRRNEIKDLQKQIGLKLNTTEFQQCRENETSSQLKMENWMRDVEGKVDTVAKDTSEIKGYLKGLADKE